MGADPVLDAHWRPGAALLDALVGAGYAVLGVAFVVYGSSRQRAVREGTYVHADRRTLRLMTALAVALGILTFVLVIAEP